MTFFQISSTSGRNSGHQVFTEIFGYRQIFPFSSDDEFRFYFVMGEYFDGTVDGIWGDPDIEDVLQLIMPISNLFVWRNSQSGNVHKGIKSLI